jgi:hypothetical protein
LIRSEEEGRDKLKGDQSKSENWKSKWKKFDKRFMLPLFTNYNVTLMDSSKRVLPIARILTTDIQLMLQEQGVKDEFEITVNHFYFTNLPLSYFS